jgi:hypothetical protein
MMLRDGGCEMADCAEFEYCPIFDGWFIIEMTGPIPDENAVPSLVNKSHSFRVINGTHSPMMELAESHSHSFRYSSLGVLDTEKYRPFSAHMLIVNRKNVESLI